MPFTATSKVTLSAACEQDRESIYKMRHAIYGRELNQHSVNSNNQLTDDLDIINHYIVAKYCNEVIGFVSITSPASKKYSVDKYFDRSCIPYAFNEHCTRYVC